MITNYPIDALLESRQEKDAFFKTDRDSPLTAQQRTIFDNLHYFPPDPALAFEITLIQFAAAEQTLQRMMTSKNEIRHYRRWGRLEFAVEGQIVGLTLFQDQGGDYFFLPFADPTNGQETYDAGRYVEVEPLPDGKFRLDFNIAYSPYCAYNNRFSCPYVPAENRLSVPICAGEQSPSGAWAETHQL